MNDGPLLVGGPDGLFYVIRDKKSATGYSRWTPPPPLPAERKRWWKR